MAIHVSRNRLEIKTQRLSAVFEGPDLVELRNSRGELLAGGQSKRRVPALEVGFSNGEWNFLGINTYAQIKALKLGERVAHVHVGDENGDACLRLLIDEHERLVVEPSAHTLRRGLMGICWRLPGIVRRLKLVAPFYQGCRQDLAHPLIAGKHWEWPHRWEAALAILQGGRGGFSVAAYDSLRHPKALIVGKNETAGSLGFQTWLNGPAHDTTAVGSLQWVIDAHDGDWRVPAAAYRDWLRREAGSEQLKKLRPEWVSGIRLALQWAGNDTRILEAVAKVIAPKKVLIHHAAWRADPYDVNYPRYRAGRDGAAFIRRCREMGFRVMPHFNYFAIDPNHSEFGRLREFIARRLGSRRLMAWRWKDGRCPEPPQGFGLLGALREEKLMYYLHPGASAWRRLLAEQIAAAVKAHRLPAVFVDQTLCTWNIDNALVEDLTMVEGMLALTKELTELEGPPAVGGEGLNEMSMRYQSFAQAHLFESHHRNLPGLEELEPVPLGDFLYGELCKTMAYANIAGDTPESVLRLEIHERLGALPSLVVRRPEDVLKPNAAVRRVLERACS